MVELLWMNCSHSDPVDFRYCMTHSILLASVTEREMCIVFCLLCAKIFLQIYVHGHSLFPYQEATKHILISIIEKHGHIIGVAQGTASNICQLQKKFL